MWYVMLGVAVGVVITYLLLRYVVFDTEIEFYEAHKEKVLVDQAALDKLRAEIAALNDQALWDLFQDLLKKKAQA